MIKSIVSCIFFLLLFAIALPAQDDNDDDESGKLGRLAGEFSDDDEDDSSRNNGDSDNDVWVDILLHSDLLINLMTNMRPGPYPYNGQAANFTPAEKYPGGTLKIGSNFFHHSADLHGWQWQFNYAYDRFGVTSGVMLLSEQLPGGRVDHLNFSNVHFSWDFLAQENIRLAGAVGFRTMWNDSFSETGPEIGGRLVALPKPPFIIEAGGTVARINSTTFGTFQSSVGVMIKRVHVYIGSNVLKSEDMTVDGLRAGIKFWY